MDATLADLAARCNDREQEASHRLLQGVLGNSAKDALQMEAREFNRAAEEYYRHGLRLQHLREAVNHFLHDATQLERSARSEVRQALRYGVRVQNLSRFLAGAEDRVLREDLSLQEITALLNLLLLLIAMDRRQIAQAPL